MTTAPTFHSLILAAGAALAVSAATPSHALDPTQVFERVSPSVWIVRTYDASERPVGLGSAVVIGAGQLVTNCHVLAKSKMVMVRRENVMYQAKLEHADAPRDLCLLQVAHFSAPAVEMRSAKDLKVGERVYAIGNPKGLEVTLSDGLISGLRTELLTEAIDKEHNALVQTTAPLSPGSSGGGLFDTEGRLVGITTFGWRDAQNLNVALPIDWIAQVPERAQAALARRNAPQGSVAAGAAPVPPGYPAPGTAWVYSFTERLYSGRRMDITVRATRVDGDFVEESVSASGQGAGPARRTVNTREARFLEFPINAGAMLIELAPYLLAANDGKAPADAIAPVGYPVGDPSLSGWLVTVQRHDWEDVAVPAGKYRALRFEIVGRRERPVFTNNVFAGRFRVTVWYAPDVKRIVKLEHQTWSAAITASGTPNSDDAIELVEYRPPR
jgi:S1-C subfamily serine protease